MGTSVAPPYANLYLYYLEKLLLDKYIDNIIFYRRYIDDIFMIIKGDNIVLDSIKLDFYKLHDNISIEFSSSIS